jgi:hypothetical protein
MNNLRAKLRMSTTVKYLLVLAAALILAALVFYGRVLWFYPHLPLAKPTVPAIDEENIAPELVEYAPFRDRPVPGDGRVVVDLSHVNNLQINDLAPLRDRIEARGATVATYDGSDGSLDSELTDATALIVVAPSVPYASGERETIVEFVQDGGLLLLAADPTRPVPEEDEFASLYSVFFPTSAVPVINSLANAFGIVYYDDYLYNLEDNAGNYRNVKFSDFDKENPLTKGLDTVVFFASHSLRSEGDSIVISDGDTRSSVRTGETAMAAATLTTGDRVLALGDITFLTPPYNTVEDNDRLVSNIADWLAVDGRMRDDLEDFPYLFSSPVDVVPISEDLLAPQIVASAADWQRYFAQAGIELNLRSEATPEHDGFFVATFDNVEPIEEYLDDAGVTVTVTEDKNEEDGKDKDDETGKDKNGDEEEKDHIAIEGFGSTPIEGTSLFLLFHGDGEPTSLIVLAEDTDTAIAAVDRLFIGDLSSCVEADTVTVCSTGEAVEEEEEEVSDGEEEDDGEEETPTAGSIFILEDNDRTTGSRTGTAEFEAILSVGYDVTTWSVRDQGIPEYDDMTGYDVYIFDSGDYAADPDNIDVLLAMGNVESGGILLIGAQPMPTFEDGIAEISDLQVSDASHPLATGFEADEVITLLPSESGVPAATMTEEDDLLTDYTVVFQRGPESEEAGTPAIIALSEEMFSGEELRVIVAAFAFYRLPETAQEPFVLNAVEWLMAAE